MQRPKPKVNVGSNYRTWLEISPALPLVVDPTDGPYRLTKSINEAVEQNFKNLILTNPVKE